MVEIVVDGTRYVPADDAGAGRIGVAITTHNRPKVLAEALKHQRRHLPPGALLAVIDDGSTPAVSDPAVARRFDTSRGIVAAKNASIEALMSAGVRHLFLFDDDAWPVADDWWRPYVDSDEPHLSYQFLDLSGPRKLRDIAETYRDDEHVAYTGQRGVMLYYDRAVIEKVGGFDPIYGRGLYEHSDLALRIHHAGLTTWPFADVVGSEKLIYSLDEHEKVTRTISPAERQVRTAENAFVHNARREAEHTGYVEYREPRDVVLTCLYGAKPDPQRPGKRMSLAQLRPLVESVAGADVIVHSDDPGPVPRARVVLSSLSGMSVFHRRWLDAYRWLRAHPEVRNVFAVDGTDVQMLRQPWADIEPGRLYLGWEPTTVGCEWMRAKHKTKAIADFIDDDPGRLLLNAGVVGGDRATVMELCHAMTRMYFDNAARRFWRQETHDLGSDMGPLNLIAYTRFDDRIVTGPRVTSVFKAHQTKTDSPAWWAHK